MKAKWNKEKCQEEALKYKTRNEFRINCGGAYNYACINNILNDVCSHMYTKKVKNRGYWTKDRCQKIALTCNSRMEFEHKYKSAYTKCLRNDWLDDVCSHLKGYYHHGYWTKENCQKEALKYNTRNDFRLKSSWAYRISLTNNWLDDICSHMIIIGNLHKRCIYAYEFTDNYVYIGLTFNVNKRKHQHEKNGTVFNHIKNNPNYIFKQLTDYILVDDAKILEGEYVKKYKNDGWNILNINKTGGLGGINKYWSKDKCHNEALKFKYYSEFTKTNAYIAARKYNWLNDITQQLIKNRIYWTKERCQDEALKYKTKSEFRKNSSSAYSISVSKKWLNDIWNPK